MLRRGGYTTHGELRSRAIYGLLVLIRAGLLAVVAVAGASSALAAQDRGTAPCPRAPGLITTEKGIVRDVADDARCRLVFRPTGVRLTGVADGSQPDPGPLVVKDGRGRYYSANADGWESTISVWGADGTYLTSFGRAGDGPGEFGGMQLSLFVGVGDSLHVIDSRAWAVFSPEHDFVRQSSARLLGSTDLLDEHETVVVLGDGRILTSNRHVSGDETYFRIIGPDGSLDDRFGTVADGTGTSGYYGRGRAIAQLLGYRGFWAAPSSEGATEYVLEHWDVFGDESRRAEDPTRPILVQSLRRRAEWFGWTGDANSSAVVGSIRVTGDRLLMVQLARPSEEYAQAMERFEEMMREGGARWTPELDEEMSALEQDLVQIVIEVIDFHSARVVASAAHTVGEIMRGDVPIPHRFFRNEMAGYVYGVGEDGLPYVEIFEGTLEAK